MPCPICSKQRNESSHRDCILQLFRENKIKSLKEWEAVWVPKPTARFLGWVYVKLA